MNEAAVRRLRNRLSAKGIESTVVDEDTDNPYLDCTYNGTTVASGLPERDGDVEAFERAVVQNLRPERL